MSSKGSTTALGHSSVVRVLGVSVLGFRVLGFGVLGFRVKIGLGLNIQRKIRENQMDNKMEH